MMDDKAERIPEGLVLYKGEIVGAFTLEVNYFQL